MAFYSLSLKEIGRSEMNRLCDGFFVIALDRTVSRMGAILCLLTLVMVTVSAEDASLDSAAILPLQNKTAWSKEFGVAIGGGLGMKIFGSDLDHHFGLSKIHFGWNRNGTYFAESWFRGEVGVFNELMAGGQFDPEGAYLIGLTPGIKYRFSYWDRVRPFLEGTAGMMITDVGRPDLGSVFEFYQQAGAGVEWEQSEGFVLSSQVRFAHVSNAGITRSNRGMNNLFFFLGANWRF